MFDCDKCGECCRNLQLSSEYADLDRGDGVCKYLDGNLCSIYANRPLKCRVEESFEKKYRYVMTRAVYEQLNTRVCQMLKERKNGKTSTE